MKEESRAERQAAEEDVEGGGDATHVAAYPLAAVAFFSLGQLTKNDVEERR